MEKPSVFFLSAIAVLAIFWLPILAVKQLHATWKRRRTPALKSVLMSRVFTEIGVNVAR